MTNMGGRRARLIGLAAGALAVASLVAIVSLGPPLAGPPPSGPPTLPPVTGPVVYYELLDAAGSSLMERRLDGRSLSRRVAQRTDVDFGRTWTVDPTGRLAIALVPGPVDQELIAVSVADGATLWTVRTPSAPVDATTWSTDGSRVALATSGGENEAREAIVVDAATGQFVRGVIPEDVVLQGFDRDGGLILRQRVPAPQAATAAWRFLRLDPLATSVERLIAAPDIGPASDWSEDVDPAAGVAVDSILGDDD